MNRVRVIRLLCKGPNRWEQIVWSHVKSILKRDSDSSWAHLNWRVADSASSSVSLTSSSAYGACALKMSLWVSTLPISSRGCLIHILSHRPSIETLKGEHTGSTPAQRRAYGKCPMVRVCHASLLVIVR